MSIGAEQAAKLEALHLAASEIANATTTEEVYQTAVDTGEDVLGFDVCGVFVADDGELRPVAQNDTSVTLETYPDDKGALGETYQTQESFLIEDAADDEVSEPSDDSFASGVSVPLGDIGVLQAISTEPAYYDETDVELAELLAVHIREAVARIRSKRDLRESKRKIERLHRVATSLESVTDRGTLLWAAVEAASDILEFDWCLLAREDDGVFRVEAASEETPLDTGDEMFATDEGVAGHVVETGESFVVDDAHDHPVANPAHESFRSGLVVPVGDAGVFAAVDDRVGMFDEQDMELAELLAASVGEAYDRIEAREQLRRRQAELDLLKEVQSRVLRHNLRNDLNVIGGAAAEAREADPERRADLLDTVERTAERLAATSERVREIKRVVDHADRIRTFEVAETVRTVTEGLDESHPDATLVTDVPDGVTVRAHSDFPLAVRCLVENGIEHDDGVPRVEVSATRSGDRVRLQVRDDGPGIPDHEVEPIERDRETDLEHGSGAGLWLVRWVVDRSDGSLHFPDTDDGTTVLVELPGPE
ncbi:GAF domain-containing protein [Halobaculum sp. MBLA0147]|uniref:sensor histidine kinase n=1 Tax=Halobaculum sp. MBLA0147 TaxID=3079934 RepID=UPI0035236612